MYRIYFWGGLTLRFSAIIVLVISLSGLIFTKGELENGFCQNHF